MRSPSAVIGDGDTMVLPDMAASVFDKARPSSPS